MQPKDRLAAFSRLADSAEQQAALGDSQRSRPRRQPAVEEPPMAEVEALPNPAPEPASPPPSGSAAAKLAELQGARAQDSITLFGYPVPRPADPGATVQTTVRMTVTMRAVIDAFCRDYGISFQDFGTLAYEHLLEAASQRTAD